MNNPNGAFHGTIHRGHAVSTDLVRWRDLPLAGGDANPLSGLPGDRLELALEIEPGDAAEVALSVLRSPDGREETRIVYDRAAGELSTDRVRASLDAGPRASGAARPSGSAPTARSACASSSTARSSSCSPPTGPA